MPSIAIVTATSNPHPPIEDAFLMKALERRDIATSHVAWDDPAVQWDAFDAAIIRSTWNFTVDVDGYVAWARRTAQSTRLFNPADVVIWNIDKHYIGELQAAGVPVIPTQYIEAGDEWVLPDLDDYVVKPVYSGGGRNSGRFRRGRDDAAATELANTVLQPGCPLMGTQLAKGRSLMIQPYVPIHNTGEKGVIVLGGEISHAIHKEAVLTDGGGTSTAPGTRGLIAPAGWDADEEAVVELVLQHVPGGIERCPYARVDVVRDENGDVRLMELELAEPQLFFGETPGSAEYFVDVLLQRL